MTDREAIRRLAKATAAVAYAVANLATGHPFLSSQRISDMASEILSVGHDLAEPAAPTVTREQAEHTRNAVLAWLQRNTSIAYHPEYLPRVPESDNWPAFFRAVADALERED